MAFSKMGGGRWIFKLFILLFFGVNATFALINSPSNSNFPLQHGFGTISFQEFLRSGKLLNLELGQSLNLDGVAYNFFDGVSDRCREHSLLWLKELGSWLTKSQVQITFESKSNQKSAKLKFPTTWAIQMLDAWGKFPAGVLSGHTQALGDFAECLQVRAKDDPDKENAVDIFKGRYCLTALAPTDKLNLTLSAFESLDSDFTTRESVSVEEFIALLLKRGSPNLFPLIGTCFPSTCSQEDTSMLLHNFYDTQLDGVLDQRVIACYTDEKPPFDSADISMIVILGIILGLCILGTALDVLVYQKASPESQKEKSTGFRAILAFSLYTNARKWADTRSGSEDLGCLHGLRFLSICWVVWAHSYQSLTAIWNIVDGQKIHERWSMLLILNGSVSVDTFFVMSGTLVAYGMLRHLEGAKGKLNIPLLYFHRYCRLTPMYAVVVGIVANLVPYLGSGPFWYMKDDDSHKCEVNWWRNLLYVSNIVDTGEWGENICLALTWYVSNDMQFYILSPFIVLALWRSKIVGFIIIAVLMLVTTITSTAIAAVKEYPAGDTPYDIYFRPWCRMTTYLIGMVLGYILYRQKSAQNPLKIRKLPNWSVVFFWLLSTFFALFILFANRSFWDPEFEPTEAEKILGYIYLGYHRFFWGLSIGWIIFACVNGYGGWVNSFLSWSAFVPLGRITFAIYLINTQLQTILHRTEYSPTVFNHYVVVNLFFAHLVMSCLIGFILTITVEAPFLQLQKIFLPHGKKK